MAITDGNNIGVSQILEEWARVVGLPPKSTLMVRTTRENANFR